MVMFSSVHVCGACMQRAYGVHATCMRVRACAVVARGMHVARVNLHASMHVIE
jgi:hypothetical protein